MPRGYEKEDLLQEGALKWLERRDDWDSSISQKSTFLFKVVIEHIYRIISECNNYKHLANRDSLSLVDGLTPCIVTFKACDSKNGGGSLIAHGIYGYGHKKIPVRKTGWEE
jgi:hypothetical protein